MSSVPLQRKEVVNHSVVDRAIANAGADCASVPDNKTVADARGWWRRHEILEENRREELELLKILQRERDPYTRTITDRGYGEKRFGLRSCCIAFYTPEKEKKR